MVKAFDKNVVDCNDKIEMFIKRGTKTIADNAFDGTNITGLHIPYGIKRIPDNFCERCSELVEISIPESVTEIGCSAFYKCSNMKAIHLPESLIEIDCNSFGDCKSLQRIKIPENTVKIGNTSFINCTNLSRINLPKSIKKIGYRVFDNTDTTIICESDSYALSYAKEENIEYRLIGTFGEEVNEEYQALNLSGYTIANRYELIDIIQKKRNTIIYKARCKLLNRFVCVEILKESMLRNPTNERTYLKAAQKAACLNSMNILSIYDCGNEQGIPYVVKEYIGMTTLDDYCSSKNQMEFNMYSVNKFKSFIKQIIAGLQYAYEKKGILHGDLCPKNVFLDSEGKVKINYNYVNDNAREKEDYAYTSPEQFMNRIISMQSDVYSLGCIMMRLISGHPPFSGTNYVDIATKHISEIIKPTMLTGEQIPDGIAEVLLKMIAKNPADRYNSYDEIIYAVENI